MWSLVSTVRVFDPSYNTEVFYFSLPKYLSDNAERFQKRVLSIILPGKSYSDRLSFTSLSSIHDRRYQLTKKTFNSIVANRDHRLHGLLPDVNISSYFLRNQRDFNITKCKTNRFKQSFLPACASDFEYDIIF